MTPEIDWNDQPPTAAAPTQAELRRCPTGAMPPFVILSDWCVGNEMHWWGGRSFPHLRIDCPACQAKRSKVWKGYLAAYDPKRRSQFIAEISANCMDALSAYKLCFGSLRGAACTLKRSATKANGRITATLTPADLNGFELPPAIDVRDSLQHMWQTDHIAADAAPENGRPIVDKPMNNTELAKRNASRFTTEGHTTTPVYEATDAQLEMLERNRLAKAKRNGHAGKPAIQ